MLLNVSPKALGPILAVHMQPSQKRRRIHADYCLQSGVHTAKLDCYFNRHP